VGTEVVVPGADSGKVGGGDRGDPSSRVSLLNHFLDGPEEPFNTPVLPGCERLAALMADAEYAQGDAEEKGPHGRFVVGAEHLGGAEALEELEELAEEGDGSPAFDGTQLEAGPRAVVEHAKNRSRISTGSLHPGPVECPDHVAAKRSRRPVLDLSSHAENLFAVIAEHAGHEGLADGHGPLVLVEPVEGVGDPTASHLGHQSLEPKHLAAHPGRLRWLDAVDGSRKRLGGRRTRPRTLPCPVGPLWNDEPRSEAQQEQDEDEEEQGHHSGCLRSRAEHQTIRNGGRKARYDRKGLGDLTMASSQSNVKEQMVQIIEAQAENSSFDKILGELAFARVIERGLADIDD